MVLAKVFILFIVYLVRENVTALSFPGPRVYVVTPAPRPLQINQMKSEPFYYHNWMRRMDSAENTTTSAPTTTTSKVKTPDLIFAEFESDGSMKKSIRKLLEKERIAPSTTTARPIYIPDEENSEVNYGLPISMKKQEEKNEQKENANTESMYSMFNSFNGEAPVPVYVPVTNRPSTMASSTVSTTTSPAPSNVQNIWHIIDSEKQNQYSGNWDEVPVTSHESQNNGHTDSMQDENEAEHPDQDGEVAIDENFALPGFATNSGSAAENESRAIRTEQNIRFPYVNLKPFQMKNLKKPMLDLLSNSKKGNNLYTNLDNFFDMKNPVRGEAQDDSPLANNEPIERYNPAQPYLPQAYGSKSKQSNGGPAPSRATASLVPPPPPPSRGNDFPPPTSYESFPPYAPSDTGFGAPSGFPSAPAPPQLSAPAPLPSPPAESSESGPIDTYSGPGSDDDGPSMDIGYRYKAPSPPAFLPTVAPMSKPFKGYSYDKPVMSDTNSMMPAQNAQDFQGYHYNKPKPQSPPSYGPSAPAPSYDPSNDGHSYGNFDSPPDHHHSDFPDLHADDPTEDDLKNIGMMPPPDMKPASYGAPQNDHGFPSDFPGDLKFPPHFDDHEYHHDHPPSTTEMPRVNRFSYYYLGKKLYYLPLYFSVYYIIYVGALIIKAILRHKIVYPNSWRPNTQTAAFFSKRSVDDVLSHDNLHEMTGKVTHAIATAAEMYMKSKRKVD